MAKVAVGMHDVAHPAFQFFHIGKSTFGFAIPDQGAIDVNLVDTTVPGTIVTEANSSENVESSSCAIQPARNSQLHCTQ